MSRYAEVVLGLPLTKTFTYTVPETFRSSARIGCRVLIPFHRRELTGIIVGLRQRRRTKDYKLKEILEVLDEVPAFSPDFLSFTKELSQAFFASWGEVLLASLPPAYIPKSQTKVYLSTDGKKALEESSLLEEERCVLELLKKGSYTPRFIGRNCRLANLSSSLSRLERKGLILIRREVKKSPARKEETEVKTQVQLEMDFSLDEKSLQVSDTISRKLEENVFAPFFLRASREKREAIYFTLIKKVLSSGRKVLFMLPEISSTQIFQETFIKRLGKKGILLHSELTEKNREMAWRRIKEGKAEVVMGPRSAVLSPLENIGLIIVDEEQDDSYYQQESPAYDARLAAWLRAKRFSALLVYGSSKPSVERYYKAKAGGFLLCIEEALPRRKIEILENRSRYEVLAPGLRRKIKEKLDKKKPVLIFFNRRGYVSFLICSRCRYIPRCARCDVSLSYHKKEDRLFCHYCGFSASRDSVCPECGGRIEYSRSYGIEVVEEELRKRFPRHRIECFDKDVARTEKDKERILSLFERGKVDILLGTQLLARQEKLPAVACIVILNPEILLTLPDFRASQKTFQSLSQMARFLSPEGSPELLIQTSYPHHHSIRYAASGDYDSFFQEEIAFRRLMNYPPFSYLAEVLIVGENLRALARESRRLFSLVKDQARDIETWGPALASVSRVRGRYRIQVVLKSKKKRALNQALKESLQSVKSKKTVFLTG